MTVCVAAICDDGNAIVLAADRFRWHGSASIEAELDDPKFYLLNDHLALMGSGSSSTIEEVMRRFTAMPADPGLTTVEAAERFQGACQATRAKHVETLYSKRFLGLKFDEFRASVTSANPGSIAWDLYNRTLNYEFGTMLIVAGVDQDGAHLHIVDDGADVSSTENGCAAIGSGGVLASVSLVRRQHRKSASISEALFNVYEAKRNAELAKGVGTTADMSLIWKGQPKFDVGKATMETLAATFERLKPSSISSAEVSEIAASLNLPASGA